MPEKSTKKKVLYIITKSVWGGAQKYVFDLATNLPKDQFEPIIAGGGRGLMAQRLTGANLPYFEIKNFQRNVNFLKDIFSSVEVFFLLLKTRPDIVHVSSSKAGGAAGLACFVYKLSTFHFQLSTVFTVHGWAFLEDRLRWQNILIKMISRLTCLFYDKIICVSENDYREAIKNKIAPARKMTVIHNGIKQEDYNFLEKERAREELAANYKSQSDKFEVLPPPYLAGQAGCLQPARPPRFAGDSGRGRSANLSDHLIGTIGEFTKNKGHINLIEAIHSLAARGYRLTTILIGWGEEKKNYESRIKNYEIGDKFFIIGKNELSDPNSANYLKALDIFVLPSVKEGLPYLLLEAGLAGLPVIASSVGGIPEIIDNGKEGILAPPKNPEALAEAIKKLMEDKNLREQFAANLRQKILSKFSLQKMLDDTIAAYSLIPTRHVG